MSIPRSAAFGGPRCCAGRYAACATCERPPLSLQTTTKNSRDHRCVAKGTGARAGAPSSLLLLALVYGRNHTSRFVRIVCRTFRLRQQRPRRPTSVSDVSLVSFRFAFVLAFAVLRFPPCCVTLAFPQGQHSVLRFWSRPSALYHSPTTAPRWAAHPVAEYRCITRILVACARRL